MPKSHGPTTTRTTRRSPPETGFTSRFSTDRGTVIPVRAAPNLPQPLGDLSTASIDTLARLAAEVVPAPKSTLEKRRRSVRMFAENLQQYPGETWQDRWLASKWEEADRLVSSLNPDTETGWTVTGGFKWLAAMRVIVPSASAMRGNALYGYARDFQAVQNDPLLDEVIRRISETDTVARYQTIAKTELAFALTSQAIPMADLTAPALLQYAWEHRRGPHVKKDKFAGTLVWDVLVAMGHFPVGTPDTMRLAIVGGRRNVDALVDSYGVQNSAVRQLFIDYISYRATEGMDYSTVVALTRNLVRNFWSMIEVINPAQPDLALDEDTYRAWRQAIDAIDGPSGPRPRHDIHAILMQVRALYLDLQSWSAEEPQRWARWVTRCPIPQVTGHAYSRARRRQSERMADRARERQPLLPLLVEHVTTRWDHYRELLERTLATAPGAELDFAGVRYRRAALTDANQQARIRRGLAASPATIYSQGTGEMIRVQAEEERAFWRWAGVEVLRLSGIRHEELQELTHLSIRRFQRSNGEVIALLVIAPSKSDRERVIPMSAELFHVIAELIRRHTRDGQPVPLIRRWDRGERTYSAKLPFLFQRVVGPRRVVFSSGWLLKDLHRICDEVGAIHPEFAGTRFTPHDFRRIFATELVNNGLPIHIGSALLGHANLQTTRGYVAVFDEDVVHHFQQFLDHRRELRPKDEYRPPTDEEWTEFEAHFDKRKVELGGCARPYGTPCNHEHACLRCPMLHVNPAMLPRLDELETNLLDRHERAQREGWLGEIDGLELTLHHLRQKRDRTRRAAGARSAMVDLGFPDARRR